MFKKDESRKILLQDVCLTGRLKSPSILGLGCWLIPIFTDCTKVPAMVIEGGSRSSLSTGR